MRPLRLTQEELAELVEPLFARGGVIQFEARGGSMRPLVRSGDLLTLEPVEGRALQVGEVGLYRTAAGGLVVHRLVRKVERGGASILEFRGDANPGAPEPVAPEQVLGRVTALEREGRTIPLTSEQARLQARLWGLVAPVGAWGFQVGDALRQGAASAARSLQGTPAYRRLGRRLLAGRVRYRQGTPADAPRWTRFQRVRGAGAASQPTLGPEDPVWSRETYLMVLALAGGRILGAADLARQPEHAELYPGWWLFGMRVGPLYRGLGIGEGLVTESLRLLGARGAGRLYLKVFPENQRAVGLYRKLGFVPAPAALQRAHAAAGAGDAAPREALVLTRPIPA